MSLAPTPFDRDKCDAYRKAYWAEKSLGSVRESDPKKAAEALGDYLEAQESLWAAAAALTPSLLRGRIDHAGWRFYLDRVGVIHCVKMPPSAILAQAGRSR